MPIQEFTGELDAPAIAEFSGETDQEIEERKKRTGFLPTIARTGGQMLSGAGTSIEDVIGENAVSRVLSETGKGITEKYPAGINSLADIAESPWLTVKEAVGQMVPQIGAGVLGRMAGGAAGGALAGPPGALVGGVLGGLAPIFVQEYGGIRDEQKEPGGTEDKIRALAAATGATALEMLGPEGRIINKGLKAPARVAGESLIKSVGKRAGKDVLIEGPTEGLQTGIEKVGASKDPLAPESIEEAAVASVMGGIGGGIVGGAHRALQGQEPAVTPPPPQLTPREKLLHDTAEAVKRREQAEAKLSEAPPAAPTQETQNDEPLKYAAADEKADEADAQENADEADEALQVSPNTGAIAPNLGTPAAESTAAAPAETAPKTVGGIPVSAQSDEQLQAIAQAPETPATTRHAAVAALKSRENAPDAEAVAPLGSDIAPNVAPSATIPAESNPAAEKATIPAVKEQLFVRWGGETYPVDSLEDASRKWDAFREKTGAGASELGSDVKVVGQSGKEVAQISYNGRVWPPGGYKPGVNPIYKPAAESTVVVQKSPAFTKPEQAPALNTPDVTKPRQVEKTTEDLQQEVERFQGQYKKGMSERVAGQQQTRLTKEQPNLVWTVEKSTIPEFPDRFDVVGRKPIVDQIAPEQSTKGNQKPSEPPTTAQPAVPAESIPEAESAAPAPASQTVSAKAPAVRINGQLPQDMTPAQLQATAEKAPYFDQKDAALAELKLRDKKGETVFGKEMSQLTEKELDLAATASRVKGVKAAAKAEQARRAQASAELSEKLKAHGTADTLKSLIEQAGWAERGGHMVRTKTGEAAGEEVISRTKWIPRAEWWPTRPVPENESYYRTAVAKAMQGGKLTDKQTEVVRFMLNLAQYEGVDIEQDATPADVAPAQQAAEVVVASADNWATLSEDDKENELDRFFGKDTRPAAKAAQDRPSTGEGETRSTGEAGQAEVTPRGGPGAARFDIGRSLTKEQRKKVLETLVDVYKQKGAELEDKGDDRVGYVYSPHLFEKSDITGAMVRYHVTLPDGKLAHPSELFPEYNQSRIERAIAEQVAAEKEKQRQAGYEADAAEKRQNDSLQASYDYWAKTSEDSKKRSAGGWATILPPEQRTPFEKDGKYITTPTRDPAAITELERRGWRKLEWNQARPSGLAALSPDGSATGHAEGGVRRNTPAFDLAAQTESDIAAKAERESNEQTADRERIKKESEAGAKSFSLAAQEKPKEMREAENLAKTGDIFSAVTALQGAVNDLAKTVAPSATNPNTGNRAPQSGMQERAVRADESGSPELAQESAAGGETNVKAIPQNVQEAAINVARKEQDESNTFDLNEEINSVSQNGGADLSALVGDPKYYDEKTEEFTEAGFKEADRLNEEKARDNLRLLTIDGLSDLDHANHRAQYVAMKALLDGMGIDFNEGGGSPTSHYLNVGPLKLRFSNHENLARDVMQRDPEAERLINVAPNQYKFSEALDIVMKDATLSAPPTPAPESAAKRSEATTKLVKVGDEVRIMKVDSVVARTETIDDVRYDLFNGAKMSEERAAVRVVDVDSGSVVSIKQYPNFDMAEKEYKDTIAKAKKAEQPAPTPSEKQGGIADKNEGASQFARATEENANIQLQPNEANREYTEKLQAQLRNEGYDFTITPAALPVDVAEDARGRAGRSRPKNSFTLAERIAGVFGKQVVWMTAEGPFAISGVVGAGSDLSRLVFLDVRSPHPAHVLLGHELAHHMEQDAPGAYRALFQSVSGLLRNHDAYRQLYQIDAATPDADISNEMIGDLMGDHFGNPEFWALVAKQSQNKTAFQLIANTIRKWINKILPMIGMRGLSSELFVTDMKVARSALAQAVIDYAAIQRRPGGINAIVPSRFSRAASTPIFYSALARGLESANIKAAPAAAWRDYIKGLVNKGTVKQDEVEWTGINDWLATQTGKVTKEQVAAFMEQGGVKVTEQEYGDLSDESAAALKEAHANEQAARSDLDKAIHEATEFMRKGGASQIETANANLAFFQDRPGEGSQALDRAYDLLNKHAPKDYDINTINDYFDAWKAEQDRLDMVQSNTDRTGKFSDYQLPGSVPGSYRELVLTLPSAPKTLDEIAVGMGFGGWTVSLSAERTAAVERAYEAQRTKPGGTFESTHFPGADYLAHTRVNDRMLPDGRKVLFVEEIQSDRAQKGRQEGFKDERAFESLLTPDERELRAFNARTWQGAEQALTDAELARAADLQTRVGVSLQEKARRHSGTIPTAPFVTKTDSWTALVLKRILRYAAEGDYAAISWTRGDQQVERYTSALRKAVDVIEWKKTPEGVQIVGYKGHLARTKFDVVGRNGQNYMGFETRAGAQQFIDQYDQTTRAHLRIEQTSLDSARTKVVDTTEKESALSDAIGKSMADRIRNDPNQTGTIEGENITVSDTGMAGYYDRIVPKVAQEVAKKVGGGKVQEIDIRLPRFKVDKDLVTGEWFYEDEGGSGEGGFKTESEAQTAADRDNAHDASGTGKQMALAITPAMREKIMGGLPLFRQGQSTGTTDTVTDAMRQRGLALRARITELIGDRPDVKVKTFWATPESPLGSYSQTPIGRVITMALNAKDELSIADHEGYHAAEDLILSDTEREIVGRAMRPGRPLYQRLLQAALSYDRENGTAVAEEITKPAEARAYGFEFYRRGDLKADGVIGRIYQKLQQFFDRVQNAIDGLGFKSAQDVFDALDEGRMADVEIRESDLPAMLRPQAFSRSAAADQTQTEAFRKWFGESKVVDAEGKPLVVYHGTTKDFGEFDMSRSKDGWGAFFTDSSEWASDATGGEHFAVDGSNVTPVFLSLQNPLVVDYGGQKLERTTDISALVTQARDGGHDGLVIRQIRDTSTVPHTQYVAFRPTQIKSAIGNTGAFDPTNSDIRFSRAAVQGGVGQGAVSGSWVAPEAARLDSLIYTLQDKQVDTRRVLQAIRTAGKKIADALDVYLQEELFHGRAAKKTQLFVDDELKPLITEMAARNVTMPEFEEYLHARHAEEANIAIAARNPNMPDGGSGMDTADAQAYLGTLDPAKKRAFEALAKRVDAINDATRQLLVDYELESQDTIDTWKASYKNYVPLHREDMGGGPGIGQGFSVRGPASKMRTGSNRTVVDILGNIAMQREKTIVRGEKNVVSTALYGLAKANPNADFWTLAKPGITTSISAETGDPVDVVDMSYQGRDNVVMSRALDKDGKIVQRGVEFNVHNERALRMALALKNLDTNEMGEILSASAKATRYFASINTQYNPIFGVVNLTRDTQQAMFNLSTTPIAGKQAEVAKHTISALKGIYLDLRAERSGQHPSSAWAQLFEEFQKEGGQTGYRDMFRTGKDRAEAIERELARAGEGKIKQFGRAVFDLLADYNSAMENAVRLAAYKVGKESGMTNQRAASMAKNLTVNFNRRGQIGTQAGALYAFFNASVQGSARLAETLTGPLGRKIIIGGITLGSLQALMLAAAGFDDDEPPQFVRERSTIIPIGGKKYITIPMPLGLHFIPNIGRIGTEFALSGFKNPGKRVMDLANVFADAFNPVGAAGLSLQTIAPTVIDPFAALAENKDWTGKPIMREDMSQLSPTPGHTRAKDTASYFSKTVSKALNYASGGTNYKPGLFSPTPDAIDYLIGQATGGVGREAMKVEQSISSVFLGEELPTYKIPLVGRFYGNAEQQSSQGNAFYNNLKAINEHEAEIRGRRKAGEPLGDYVKENPEARLIQLANATERQVSLQRKRKRELIAKDADKEAIKAVDLQITAKMKAFNDRVKQVSASAQ